MIEALIQTQINRPIFITIVEYAVTLLTNSKNSNHGSFGEL